MLTEIILESLLNMDDDTLNAVLESCDADELDFIDTVVTEKAYSNTKRVIGNILHGSDATNKKIMAEGRIAEKQESENRKQRELADVQIRQDNNETDRSRIADAKRKADESRKKLRDAVDDMRSYRATGPHFVHEEPLPPDVYGANNDYRNKQKAYHDLKHKVKNTDEELKTSKNRIDRNANDRLNQLHALNTADVIRNNTSMSAKVGDTLHQSVTGLTKAVMSKHKLGKVTKASKNI